MEFVRKQSAANESQRINAALSENRQKIEELFAHCRDLTILPWGFGPNHKYEALSVYFDSLIDQKKENHLKSVLQDLVTHIIGPARNITPQQVMEFYSLHGVSEKYARVEEDFNNVVHRILRGHVVIFINGCDRALVFDAKEVESRSVTEPISESVVIGPHEGTVENLGKNIGLLRTRLQTVNFKIEGFYAGKNLNTEIVYGYLEGAVNPETLAIFKQRIAKIDQQDILETSYIESLIEDSVYSPFPQYRYTERPDVAAASLLDGKIIVLVQGTGSILICPGLFVELFHSCEDYYQRTIISTMVRTLRMIAYFISLCLPSIYIALSNFHIELIPTILLLSFLDSREGIPFPSFVEALIMEFFMELLREAGIRLPRHVGSAVSIVGALVIGQAAISARIASPAMVVVVSLTGIASFAIPQYNFAASIRILRFPLMMLSATLGGFGLMVGLVLISLHLTSLQSLGQPYLTSLAPLQPRQLLKVLVRMPLQFLVRSSR